MYTVFQVQNFRSLLVRTLQSHVFIYTHTHTLYSHNNKERQSNMELTNFMELSPSSEAASYAATQELPPNFMETESSLPC
jgi:hypothetical protein